VAIRQGDARAADDGARCARRCASSCRPKLWLGSFLATSLIYLVQMDAEGISTVVGRCWHRGCTRPRSRSSPCLPVVVAVVYRAVEQWLAEYETYASRDCAPRCSRRRDAAATAHDRPDLVAPRSLFGARSKFGRRLRSRSTSAR
jgi:hypothetical protein